MSVKTLPFYTDYFNVPYPLPKIDLIAIPDFAAGLLIRFVCALLLLAVLPGAMENWGLVTYRERLLLVDPENTSEISKQYVALVVGESKTHIFSELHPPFRS